jgi:ATP-dependent DNA helicase PIF1
MKTSKRKYNDDDSERKEQKRSRKMPLLKPTLFVKKKDEIDLSTMQQRVVDVVNEGKNVFFSGVAGTGKSFLLEYLIKHVLPVEGTFVTASTGIASVNISGTTLHSFAGVGLAKESAEKLAKDVGENKSKREKWKNAKYLIIDEISMIDGILFDKLEYIARFIRKNNRPFGGIRLILSGDFLQLPPVEKVDGKLNFCFMAQSWQRAVNEVVILNKVFRQKSDLLVDTFNELRVGKVTPEAIKMFTACVNRKFDDDGIEPTLLFAIKKEVKEINDEKLANLPGPPALEYKHKEFGKEGALNALKKNFNGVLQLFLKVRTKVMLVKNLAPLMGLVNGSSGVVVGFAKIGDDIYEASKEYDKSLSLTSSNRNEKKQLIANSKDGQDDESASASSEEEENDELDASGEKKDDTLYPIVQFACGPRMLIVPDKWETKVQGKVVAKIIQVPLILGWSLTMHKCQGMTLDRVQLSMKTIFEYAQAYVAFSRIRSIDDLCLLDFSPHVIRAHPLAKKFYSDIVGVLAPPQTPLLKDDGNGKDVKNNNGDSKDKVVIGASAPPLMSVSSESSVSYAGKTNLLLTSIFGNK